MKVLDDVMMIMVILLDYQKIKPLNLSIQVMIHEKQLSNVGLKSEEK